MTAQERAKRLVDGYRAGWSMERICRATGYSRRTAQEMASRLRKAGVSIPRLLSGRRKLDLDALG